MAKNYNVEIIETLSMTVEVEADSREEAELIVLHKWKKCEYVLDDSNFIDVEFKTTENEASESSGNREER